MSSPHFYQGDEKFVQDIFGMRPNKEQHQTMIDINPVGTSTLILIDPLQTCFRTYKTYISFPQKSHLLLPIFLLSLHKVQSN